MTSEYDDVFSSNTQNASDPQPEAADTADTADTTDTTDTSGQEPTGSIFDKTVFGSAQGIPQPQPQPQPEPQPQPAAPEAEPTVRAERVQDYTSPAGGYSTYHTASSVPPYGTQGSTVPPYGRSTGTSSVPPYGTQSTAYGAPGYTAPAYPGASAPRAPQKKSGKGLKVFFTVIALIVLAGVMFGVGTMIGGRHRRIEVSDGTDNTAATAQVGAPELETKASPASDSSAASGTVLTPTQIAAKVRPWSVGILVYSKTSSGVASEGSGVLWKEDSSHTYTYIITCAHVINGSGLTYSVQTEDSTTYDAELVGLDAKTDLGVLRIKKTGLELAEFGDSSKLQVGDPVYAIGNPGGTEFFGSFTDGIVSAIDRSVKSTYTMICIQHTAAINPGNSGGALVNQYGQVVGINSQKIMSTSYEGMGFSIPIKSAQPIVNNLATYGYIKDRPKLGITYAEAVNYQQYGMLIKIKGLPSGSLIITEVSEDSSLANTEVRPYDMIIKVNGEELSKPEVLLSKIENGKVGDKLTLTLCRVDNNYQTREFTVTATLVEEKKEAEKETTTQPSINPYDFFNDDFFNGLF